MSISGNTQNEGIATKLGVPYISHDTLSVGYSTGGEREPIPFEQEMDTIETVRLNGEVLLPLSSLRAEMSLLRSSLLAEGEKLREQDTKRTEQLVATQAQGIKTIVRRFGWSAMTSAVVAIGLGIYLVKAENVDMIKIDAIYNRISAVEASPFQTGELVRFKASGYDRSGAKMQQVAISALDIPKEDRDALYRADYTECRGEILEHWQTEQGIWYASVTLDGAFKSRGGQGEFVKSLHAVIFVIPEGRLSLANDQINTVHQKHRVSSKSRARN